MDFASLQKNKGRIKNPAPTILHPNRLFKQPLQAPRFVGQARRNRWRRLNRGVFEKDPKFLPAYIILSHTLLQEGNDWAAAERVLRRILLLDPNNLEAQNNLEILLHQKLMKNPGSS